LVNIKNYLMLHRVTIVQMVNMRQQVMLPRVWIVVLVIIQLLQVVHALHVPLILMLHPVERCLVYHGNHYIIALFTRISLLMLWMCLCL
jgi:hypothetical protein